MKGLNQGGAGQWTRRMAASLLAIMALMTAVQVTELSPAGAHTYGHVCGRIPSNGFGCSVEYYRESVPFTWQYHSVIRTYYDGSQRSHVEVVQDADKEVVRVRVCDSRDDSISPAVRLRNSSGTTRTYSIVNGSGCATWPLSGFWEEFRAINRAHGSRYYTLWN
jgi:hypothetical protein